MKKHAPATQRNRAVIADVLAKELPSHGTLLEVASGSGEHAIYFAAQFPDLTWQPSDPSPDALASIAAYRADYDGENVPPPIELDASNPETWTVESAAAILCCNMVHISPWEATMGLFAGASRVLSAQSPLILYGPYFEPDREPAQSNLEFDRGLRARDPRWGIRQLEAIDDLAQKASFFRSARYEMPANNLTLVYRSG